MKIYLFFSLFAPLARCLLQSGKSIISDGTYKQAAVVTNSKICTDIALEVLSEDGSAADAAIAALLCEGITNPQSMGIGGGFLLTIYNCANKSVQVLNAREAAPDAANPNMFHGLSEMEMISSGRSVAVPGELMGYWLLHKKYGKMAWYDLFRPAIDLCRHGVPVTYYTAKMIAKVKDEIKHSPSIKELLTNPLTKRLYEEGELMIRPELGDTLEMIAKHGPKVFYDGELGADLIADIAVKGGVITEEDLRKYRAVWMEPVSQQIGEYTIYTSPAPGSGQLLLLILDLMTRRMCRKEEDFWINLVEIWKYTYGLRSELSGPEIGTIPEMKHFSEDKTRILEKLRHFRKTSASLYDYASQKPTQDFGTSHVCILAPNGDAVSVTSTINLSFGALFVSESTGIILNNEMIDFAVPMHFRNQLNQANVIRANYQPMSSMCPTIVTNTETKDVRLVLGSSGGFKIITSASFVMLQHLYMGACLSEAILHRRLHHQLEPMVLEYEEGFPADILHALGQVGHKLQQLDNETRIDSSSSMAMYSCVNAIAIIGNDINVVGDFRRRAVGGGF